MNDKRISKISPGQVAILNEFEKITLITKTIPEYWDTKPLRNGQIDRLLARGFIAQDVDRRGDERPFYKITSKGAARIGMEMCSSCGGATHPEEAACLHCGTTKSWAQTSSPETREQVNG